MNLTIRVDTSGALLKGQGPDVIQRNIEAAITEATLFIEGQAKMRTPRRTGNLARSIQHDFQGKGTPVIKGIVATAQPYALPVETGTGVHGPKGVPFVIKAKPGKALFWPGAAHPVKQVTIQGMKGAQMFKGTLVEDQTAVEAIFARYGLKIAVELGQ